MIAKINPSLRTLRVPKVLAQHQAFLIWRFEEEPGDTKPRKVPYYASGKKRAGLQGGPSDLAQLTSFEAARAAAIRLGYDGIGFAPNEALGIVALDFDDCFDGDRIIAPEIEEIVSKTYAEYSPSGKGLRAFVMGNLGNRKSSPTPSDPFGFEVFSSNGFVTLTGNAYWTTELFGNYDHIPTADQSVIRLCERRFGKAGPDATIDEIERAFNNAVAPLEVPTSEIITMVQMLDPDMGRAGWIKVGMALHHQYEGSDEGFDIWDSWSTHGSKYPSEHDLRQQWDSFTRREGTGRVPVTLASLIWMARDAGYRGAALGLAGASPAAQDGPVASSGAELLERAAELADKAPDGSEGKYRFLTAGEIARQPLPNWIIKGVLPRADLVVLYGASGAGKSFVAFDVAGAIARGVPWRGRKTEPGRVCVVAAEGGGGMSARTSAYCIEHGITPADFGDRLGILSASPSLLDMDDCAELAAAINRFGKTDVVILDTFAQMTPGANENAAEDMGKALRHARSIREATGAVVILVHHSGKDAGRGARGWSGIRAAADAEIEVLRHEDSGAREIRTTKMKDGDDGLRWGFELRTIVVGVDADGDEVTSCAVGATEPPAPAQGAEFQSENRKKKRSRWQNIVLDAAAALDPSITQMPVGEFIAHAVAYAPGPAEGERDTRLFKVQRALTELCKEKGDDAVLAADHGYVVIL